ncbi:MAG: NFACT family protein [Candidatus Aenigmarchaeota archaeon]|nr:NFACT family protein [Candidatus Aenigmarchaeota archaeon]
MEELSSLDIFYLMKEFSVLERSKIRKVYVEEDEVHFSLYSAQKGSGTLVIGKNYIFYTNKPLNHSPEPNAYCMHIRKRVIGQIISSFEQINFERIIKVSTRDFDIIVELFSKGNIIITDKEGKIISLRSSQSWKDRELKSGLVYELPPSRISPVDMKVAEFSDALSESDKKIVPFLARALGLGGKFAEEAVFRSGIDKNTVCSEFDKVSASKVCKSVKSLFCEKIDAYVVDNDALPFIVGKYKDVSVKRYDDFNSAISSVLLLDKEKAVVKSVKGEGGKDKLEVRLNVQNNRLKGLLVSIDELQKKAEAIYTHYGEIEKLVAQLKDIASKHGWEKVKKKVEGKGKESTNITGIDLKDKVVSLKYDDLVLDVYYEENLAKSADLYYSKMKKYKAKIDGLEKSKKNSEEEIKCRDKTAEDKARKRVLRPPVKQQWYHSFRWFISSEGFVCVAGKDAKSNERLIKKHMNTDDVVIHAELAGSPFVVVKSEGKVVGKKSIHEAGIFGACYSRAWNIGVGSVDVFSARPDQVSKEAPSGEFISKGSFMIYGKKEYYNVELKLAFGLINNYVNLWPLDSIGKHTKKMVVIVPGRDKAKSVGVAAKKKLYALCSKEEKEVLDIVGVDEFASKIPSAKGSVLK